MITLVHCQSKLHTASKYSFSEQLGKFNRVFMHQLYEIDASNISLETRRVQIRPMGDPRVVAIMFLTDRVTQEANETLTLQLLPTPSTLQTIPTGEAVSFKNVIELTIVDADSNFRMTVKECSVDT